MSILQSRRRRARIGPRSAAVARRLRRGLDACGRDPPQWPAAFATVSTQAAEDRLFGPSPRSRRRRPRCAAVACLPRRGLDAGGRRRPICAAARLPRRGLDAGGQDPPRCPAAFAVVSTPATEDSIFGRPTSPRSRRRRPRCAIAPRWPASLAAVLAPAAEDSLFCPPSLPRSRGRRPKTACPSPAAVARCFDACGRGPPRWPAALTACLFF
jgi:hypothetical protein